MTARRKRPPAANRRANVVIEVATPSARWKRVPAAERQARAAARAALAGAAAARRLGRAKAELSLVLADDGMVRRLNRRWRGRDRATNVLSFPAAADVPPGAPRLLGDVVLAFETVAREAAAQGKPFSDHLAHLVAHGVLHLVGFDHEEDGEARRMETLERRVLARIGIPDPYRERAGDV